MDEENLPFPNEYFDGVLMTHVIEHLHSPFQLGKEIQRVMKPGARIFLETPNWTTIFFPSIGFHRGQHNPLNFFDDPTHIKPWTKQGIFEFLEQGCGLKVEYVGTVRNWIRLPFDIPLIIYGIITGNRSHVIKSLWNLLGWCICAIGMKNR